MINVFKYANHNLHLLEDGTAESLIHNLNVWHKVNSPLEKHIVSFLKEKEIYAVWDMPGHRGTYYFPTEQDCELWQDYLYQCAE